MELEPAEIDIFLQPGEVYFGERGTRIRTLLGSCVAITVWHPRKHIGGMCHYLLPARSCGRIDVLEGRYADEAILLLLQEMRRAKTDPEHYQVKVFGGGNMFLNAAATKRRRSINVGDRNIAIATELLARHGLSACAEHVGGDGYRQIIFELSSGAVWLRQHGNKLQSAEAP